MRDIIPRKQQTSHSAWVTPALRPSGRDGVFYPPNLADVRENAEREGEHARSWRTGSEAVNRLHREPTPQGGADDPSRGRTITRSPKVRAQDTHKQQKKKKTVPKVNSKKGDGRKKKAGKFAYVKKKQYLCRRKGL